LTTYNTRVAKVADGSTTRWTFSFAGGYILPEHVKVSIAGAEATTAVLETAGTVVIEPALADGVEFEILRRTPVDSLLVDWANGADISENNLDASTRQAVFAAAETEDFTQEGILSVVKTDEPRNIYDVVGGDLLVSDENGNITGSPLGNVETWANEAEEAYTKTEELLSQCVALTNAVEAPSFSAGVAATAVGDNFVVFSGNQVRRYKNGTSVDAFDHEFVFPESALPHFLELPEISGTLEVNQTVTGSDGVVFNGSPTAREWLVDGSVVGTGGTLVLPSSSEGGMLAFRVTATGDLGTTEGTSLTVGPIAASPYNFYEPYYFAAQSNAQDNTDGEYLKGYDAGATNDESTIVTGSTIDVVTAALVIDTSVVSVVAEVYRRDLLSGDLDTASKADMELMSSTTIAAVDTPLIPAAFPGSGVRWVALELDTSVTVESGYCYFAAVRALDSNGDPKGMRLGFATATQSLPGRQAGFYQETTGSGTWTTNLLTRTFSLGFAKNDANGIIPDPDNEVPFLTAEEELGLKPGGPTAWGAKFMGDDTVGDGLAQIAGLPGAWAATATTGVKGTDFGLTLDPAGLTAASSHYAYNSGNQYIQFNNNTGANSWEGHELSGYEMKGLTAHGTNANDVHVDNCLIDGLDFTPIHGIRQDNGDVMKVTATNLDMTRMDTVGHNTCHTTIDRVHYYDVGGDPLKVGTGSLPTRIRNSFGHRYGIQDAAHGDGIQMASGDVRNVVLYNTTLYLPGPASIYDQGTLGSNIGFYITCTQPNDYLEDIYAIGGILVGRNASAAFNAEGANSVVNCCGVINARLGGAVYSGNPPSQPGNAGAHPGEIQLPSNDGGRLTNILVWNNRLPDGSRAHLDGAFALQLGLVGYNGESDTFGQTYGACGVIEYDPAIATPAFIDILRKLGEEHGVETVDSSGNVATRFIISTAA
jgi:hypothetical protein